jgi:methylmalonyl-CoA/ethylmalonyl-CoA epimerase
MGTNDLIPPRLESAVAGFDHVGLAVHDVASVLPLLDLLGATYHDGGHHPTGGFRWVQFIVAGGAKFEVLAPLDPDDADNFVVRFLATRGEGMHHVTFAVDDLGAAITAFEAAGYRIVGEDRSDENWREAFVHPGTTNGLLVQLAEWNEDLAERPSMSLEAVLAAP